MTPILTWYVSIALIVVFIDACVCLSHAKVFRLIPSILMGAFWPITTIAIIVSACLIRKELEAASGIQE